METHILNGDAMIDRMEAAGFEQLIVCRECLVDGPVNAQDMDTFWKIRAAFIEDNIEADEEKYYEYAVKEFEKMKAIQSGSEINCWFGDDLFCQANLWFVVNYLDSLSLSDHLYRVFPIIKEELGRWAEYGGLKPDDLRQSYEARVAFTAKDVELAKNLWSAYAANELGTLQSLAATKTNVFHDLDKVVQAHVDRFAKPGELSRPEKVLKEIMDSGVTDFNKLFPIFFKKEGIYGFGDVQVKKLLVNLA
jgi:hypothetical protein